MIFMIIDSELSVITYQIVKMFDIYTVSGLIITWISVSSVSSVSIVMFWNDEGRDDAQYSVTIAQPINRSTDAHAISFLLNPRGFS